MRTPNRNRSGFSLVEVVIALSVIVIVSITSISIVLSSVSSRTAATNKAYAQNFADNLWECFKASDSQEEFLACVLVAEGEDLSSYSSTPLGDGSVVYTVPCGRGKATAVVTVCFSSAGDTFAIEVTDQKDKEILSFFYEKEVTP